MDKFILVRNWLKVKYCITNKHYSEWNMELLQRETDRQRQTDRDRQTDNRQTDRDPLPFNPWTNLHTQQCLTWFQTSNSKAYVWVSVTSKRKTLCGCLLPSQGHGYVAISSSHFNFPCLPTLASLQAWLFCRCPSILLPNIVSVHEETSPISIFLEIFIKMYVTRWASVGKEDGKIWWGYSNNSRDDESERSRQRETIRQKGRQKAVTCSKKPTNKAKNNSITYFANAQTSTGKSHLSGDTLAKNVSTVTVGKAFFPFFLLFARFFL